VPLVLVTDRHDARSGFVASWNVLGPLGWFDAVVFYSPARTPGDVIRTGRRVARHLRSLRANIIYNLVPTQRTRLRSLRDFLFFRGLVGAVSYTQARPFEAPTNTVNGQLPVLEPEWARLLGMIGGEVQTCFLLPSVPEHERLAENLFRTLAIEPDATVVALAPGAKMPAKRWPSSRFVEVIQELRENNPGIICLVLGDRADSENWRSTSGGDLPNVFDLAGSLSVMESAAILRRCTLFIGNDTGTMHLAAMAGCPGVALFSARDYPGRWHPAGAEMVALRTTIECEGCMLIECVARKNECLTRIPPALVIEASTKILAARIPRRRSAAPN
jgi:hypothetical protein